MTLKDCIDFVDAIEPNAYTNDQKTEWVSEVEGKVHTEVRLLPVDDFAPLVYADDKNNALTVKSPHDKLYRDYLQARIHLANGEYDRYQNHMAVFNAEWGEFVRWYAKVYEPTNRWARNW